MYLAQSGSPATDRGGEIKIAEVTENEPGQAPGFFLALLYHANAPAGNAHETTIFREAGNPNTV